jgi:hypothetical protein
MEDALEGWKAYWIKCLLGVLILVLMEDALEEVNLQFIKKQQYLKFFLQILTVPQQKKYIYMRKNTNKDYNSKMFLRLFEHITPRTFQ